MRPGRSWQCMKDRSEGAQGQWSAFPALWNPWKWFSYWSAFSALWNPWKWFSYWSAFSALWNPWKWSLLHHLFFFFCCSPVRWCRVWQPSFPRLTTRCAFIHIHDFRGLLGGHLPYAVISYREYQINQIIWGPLMKFRCSQPRWHKRIGKPLKARSDTKITSAMSAWDFWLLTEICLTSQRFV